MEAYFTRYSTGGQSVPSNTVTDGEKNWTITTPSGHTCSGCSQWIPYGTDHCCSQWPYYGCAPTFTITENKTEKAYVVLKKLVNMEIIPEPKTYKAFCDLIEGIRAAL